MALTLFLGLLCSAASAAELSVVSWNIHKGHNWEVVARAMHSSPLAEADVVALQEVLTHEEGRQGQRLARIFGGRAIVVGRDVILSRLPVADFGEVRVNPATGRRAAWADLRVAPGKKVRVYSVHLSYKVKKSPFIPELRKEEMTRLLNHASGFPGPVVIAGDYNTVGWIICCQESAPLLSMLEENGFSDATAGSPGRTQLWTGKVDWIFAKGLSAVSSRLGRYAGSDHRWLLSVFAPAPDESLAPFDKAAGIVK